MFDFDTAKSIEDKVTFADFVAFQLFPYGLELVSCVSDDKSYCVIFYLGGSYYPIFGKFQLSLHGIERRDRHAEHFLNAFTMWLMKHDSLLRPVVH